jgi:hypothetical protein
VSFVRFRAPLQLVQLLQYAALVQWYSINWQVINIQLKVVEMIKRMKEKQIQNFGVKFK